jgi:hypothetical protein
MLKLTRSERFFFKHAGYCWTPGKERPRQGRANCARILARAELLARENGAVFEWKTDPDGADVQTDSGDREHLPAVYCVLYVRRGSGYRHGASLWSITESPDLRERQNYRRVVEAELASEVFAS